MEGYRKQWEECRALIRQKVDPHVYDVWFAPVACEGYDEATRTVVLSVPCSYVYEYLEQCQVEVLSWALASAFGRGVRLNYRIRKEQAPSAVEYPDAPVIPHVEISDARERLQNGLRHYLGEKARWIPAYDQVAQWLADNKGRGLLCIGPSGLGKTLICEKILPVILGRRVRTVTAGDLYDNVGDLMKERAVIIDDLGKEPAKRYGQPDTSFYKLCDAAERNGILLIVTTNLSTNTVKNPLYQSSIEERYGQDVISRLRAVIRVVEFKGDDMRC